MSPSLHRVAPPPSVRLARIGLLFVVVGALVAAPRQAAAQAAADWKAVEGSQMMTDYRVQLREGPFDDRLRGFLTTTALPQLGLPVNRPVIDRVRRRMRELLCGDVAAEPKALDGALQTVAEFMTAVATDGKADLAVRVNAMLLVGELKAKDGKPWAGAASPLMAVVGDAALPLSVRIAAAEGLARHVDAAAAGLAPTVGPALVKLLAAKAAGDQMGTDWLTARALGMLTAMGAAAPADTAAAASAILQDASRPPVLRARAALAVGATARPGSPVAAGKVIEASGSLARGTLEAELPRGGRADAAVRDAEEPQAPAGGAASGSSVAEQACRRAAWVLFALARGLAGDDGKGGLAAIAAADAPAARELAETLKTQSQAIDSAPTKASIQAALAALAGGAAAAPAAPAKPAANAPASEPAADAPPFANPFGK